MTLEENEEGSKTLRCDTVYGLFGCPSLGLAPHHVITICVYVKHKKKIVVEDVYESRRLAEEKKARVIFFFVQTN